MNIRIKSGEQCIPGSSVPRRLGGVICKSKAQPEGLLRLHQASGTQKNINARSTDYFISKMPKP